MRSQSAEALCFTHQDFKGLWVIGHLWCVNSFRRQILQSHSFGIRWSSAIYSPGFSWHSSASSFQWFTIRRDTIIQLEPEQLQKNTRGVCCEKADPLRQYDSWSFIADGTDFKFSTKPDICRRFMLCFEQNYRLAEGDHERIRLMQIWHHFLDSYSRKQGQESTWATVKL
jgi:hypothetical protein